MDAANRYLILAALDGDFGLDDLDLAVGALPAALLAALALPRPPAPAPQIPPAFHGAASSRAKSRMAMGADRKYADKPEPEDEDEWTKVASRKYGMDRGVSPDPDPVVPTEDEDEQGTSSPWNKSHLYNESMVSSPTKNSMPYCNASVFISAVCEVDYLMDV